MNKIKNAFKFIWKYNRAWLLTASITLVLVFVISMVATQNAFLSGTISTVLGGDRRVLISGDPTAYQYYRATTDEFLQFEPEQELDLKASGKKRKKTVLEMANSLNEEIASEGFVLLKNDNGALPIATPETEGANVKTQPRISVFGKNSVNLVYGGSGSGGGDESSNVNLYDSLKSAGFDCNPTLKSFYEKNSQSGSGRPGNPSIGAAGVNGFATGETPVSKYNSSVSASYADYSDAALIVISRIGGEGFDLPRTMVDKNGAPIEGANADDHYLRLDNNEKDLIKMVCGKFQKVIVIINCSTSMELGFIKDNADIDAAIWIGSPGGRGVNALGKILNGQVNPSGRLVDTYARDFTKDPTFNNFGDNKQTGGSNTYTQGGGNSDYHFVEYRESIYVGYRYYETKAYDEEDFGNMTWYDENVVYPFGYGLGYGKFDWQVEWLTQESELAENGKIEVKVGVTNKGALPGKDVVQLYYTPQYRSGQIEKPYVVLGAYEKTELIPSGETRYVTLSLNVNDMASYDYDDANENGHIGYEIEHGNYTVRVGRNAHECWAGGNADVYGATGGGNGKTYAVRTDINLNTASNRFDDVSEHFKTDANSYGSTLFTRQDFKGTAPVALTAADREVDDEFIEIFTFKYNDKDMPYYSDKNYTQGYKPADGKYIQLYDLINQNDDGTYYVNYNDERWETILDYLTVNEMIDMVGTGNFKSKAIIRINKPLTIDPDGPAGFTNFMGDPSVHDTCFYASECVIGATWNKDLAHDMGVMIGIESITGYTKGDGRTYSGWYAPAVNIHRSQFGGRNWEYYSEDPLLSGKTGANVVMGANKKGVYTFVKHFALNEQETNRDTQGLVTWADEQAIREIYLKPFEIIVKEGKTQGIMSSFNRIGATWAGGSYALLTEVLRNEWGFTGAVISDYNVNNAYMHPDQMIRAGGDLNLTQAYFPSGSGANFNSTQIASLRRAVKNVLYVVSDSNAMNGMGEGNVWGYAIPLWMVWVILLNVGLVVIFAVWGVLSILHARKKIKLQNEEVEKNTQ